MKINSASILRILPFSFLLLFAACETSIDFDKIPVAKLTIVSQIAPDSPDGQRAYVYASQSPSDSSQFYTPDNLNVKITEVGSVQTTRLNPKHEDGKTFYPIPKGFVKSGSSYRIEASSPGFESVYAITTIPWPSTISNLSIKNSRIDPSELNEFKKIVRYTLQFNIDHFESNRYYHIVFYNEYKGEPYPSLINPEPSDNQAFIHHYSYGVLIDRENLAEGKPLTFNFLDWVYGNNDIQRVNVELRLISEEYYKYQTSLARQLIVRQDPFAEPVTIFNNIEAGYGNFSGFTQFVTSSDFPL